MELESRNGLAQRMSNRKLVKEHGNTTHQHSPSSHNPHHSLNSETRT
jgi:hypothetical protein